MAARTILVVDDEPRIAAIAADYLRHAGYDVTTAGDGVRALQLARARRPDLIVLDLTLPGKDGLDIARALRGVDIDALQRAIDAHVKNIRRKIERDTRNPRYILTVYGVGYKAAES